MATLRRAFDKKALPRRMAKIYRKPSARYAKAIGELVWASNFAHGAFRFLFCSLLKSENDLAGDDIWHALKSDSSQRDILLASAHYANISPGVYNRIVWIHRMAGKLATIRNDAVHTEMFFRTDSDGGLIDEPPMVMANPARRKRLDKNPKLLEIFNRARGDFIQLGAYAFLIGHSIQYEGASWPRKPRLLSKLK
jgi:hypothetical protein